MCVCVLWFFLGCPPLESYSDDLHIPPPLRQRPRLGADNLALTVGDKVDDHADEVVQRRVGALVDEDGGERHEGQQGEAELEGAVDGGAGDEAEGPLEADDEEAEEEVDELQRGEGLHGAVEGLGEEIPEDFGPEEAMYGSGDLIYFGTC